MKKMNRITSQVHTRSIRATEALLQGPPALPGSLQPAMEMDAAYSLRRAFSSSLFMRFTISASASKYSRSVFIEGLSQFLCNSSIPFRFSC